MIRQGSRLELLTDGEGRFAFEFPLQTKESRTLRVVAVAQKDVPPTVLFEEGVGRGDEFVADEEWRIVGLRATADLIAALEGLLSHAFHLTELRLPNNSEN